MTRRGALGGIALLPLMPDQVRAEPPTLATAPIAMAGDWGRSLPASAAVVVERMRAVSLAGVPLLSDRQPTAIGVENRTSGPPHIWLHADHATMAEIVVDIGERDWSKLAYQFGHELGHVLANSWERDARPVPGSQWLEEALVEAFSLRGLGLLAESWGRDPPFPGDAAFGAAIQRYRDNQLAVYAGYAASQGSLTDARGWFQARREALRQSDGMSESCEALIPWILGEYAGDPARVGELGALNLWPKRGVLVLEPYLNAWEQRCRALGAAGWMPRRLRETLLGG